MSLKKIITILALSLICLFSFAQTRFIEGQAVDNTKKPLAGVLVKAATGETTTTGQDGTFRFDVQWECTSISFSLDGYSQVILKVKGGYLYAMMVPGKSLINRVAAGVRNAKEVGGIAEDAIQEKVEEVKSEYGRTKNAKQDEEIKAVREKEASEAEKQAALQLAQKEEAAKAKAEQAAKEKAEAERLAAVEKAKKEEDAREKAAEAARAKEAATKAKAEAARAKADAKAKEESNKARLNAMEEVDLGLSVKWASCNLGFTARNRVGYYYSWGEIDWKADYSWPSYQLGTTESDHVTKYINKADGKTELELTDDAARAALGGSWRIPTSEEWIELKENCNWSWTQYNGLEGYKVVSKKDGYTENWIFLPAAGVRLADVESEFGEGSGFYWSSTLDPNNSSNAFQMNFSNSLILLTSYPRNAGLSIRPVTN